MRYIGNFFITGFIILVFQWIGWITIAHTIATFAAPWVSQLIVAGIIGLIFTIGLLVADWAWTFFQLITCCTGCVFYPIYLCLLGIAGFWLVGVLLPGWVIVSANFWITALMGVIVAVIRIHPPRAQISSSSS